MHFMNSRVGYLCVNRVNVMNERYVWVPRCQVDIRHKRTAVLGAVCQLETRHKQRVESGDNMSAGYTS
jgi:hypothetical protein